MPETWRCEEERPRESAARDLTFTDKEAGVYFPRSSYARRAYMSHAVIYTHTQHAYSPIYREGNLEIHGRLSTCRFLPSPRMRVWCAIFSPPRGSLVVPHIFLSFFLSAPNFSPRCAPNFGYVRRRRPWSHAAIGRV